MKISLFFLFSFYSISSSAKLFTNSYISFNLPPRWECTPEETEYVCRSTARNPKEVLDEYRQAIIVLTAKEIGASDSTPLYLNYLKQPKTTSDRNGKPIQSTVKDVRINKISGHEWTDGLHLNSEVPNYYTRYLATTKTNIAVLVTFSAHQKYYSRYSPDFIAAIQSLTVKGVALPDKMVGTANTGEGGIVSGPIGNIGTNDLIQDAEESYVESGSEPSDTKEKLFLLGIILAAIGAYIFMKKKKKQS